MVDATLLTLGYMALAGFGLLILAFSLGWRG